MNDQMVYCFASPEERTYEAARAAYDYWWKIHNKQHGHLNCRDYYPATGWTLEELIGSTWINVHTCSFKYCTELRELQNGLTLASSDDYKYFGVGLWWNERYVADHWVRFDVLAPEEQFTWYVASVEYQGKRITELLAEYRQHKNDPLNRNSKKDALRKGRLDERDALADLEAFAAKHGLNVGFEVINAGLVSTDNKPVQMRLF